MTDKEKFINSIEALRRISTGEHQLSAIEYAAKVYAELTAPEIKTVKGWVNVYTCPEHVSAVYETKESADKGKNDRRIDCIEITYSRPIEEKEEVWYGQVLSGGMLYRFPVDWIGKAVEVRLKGE